MLFHGGPKQSQPNSADNQRILKIEFYWNRSAFQIIIMKRDILKSMMVKLSVNNKFHSIYFINLKVREPRESLTINDEGSLQALTSH